MEQKDHYHPRYHLRLSYHFVDAGMYPFKGGNFVGALTTPPSFDSSLSDYAVPRITLVYLDSKF